MWPHLNAYPQCYNTTNFMFWEDLSIHKIHFRQGSQSVVSITKVDMCILLPSNEFYHTLLQTSLEMISVPRVLSKTFQEIEGLKEPCPLLIAAMGGSAKEVLKSSLWWWVRGGIGGLDSYRPRTRVMTWPARTVTPFMVFWSMWRGLTYRPKASGFPWHRQQQNIQE